MANYVKGNKIYFCTREAHSMFSDSLALFSQVTENTVYTKDEIHHGLTTAQINIVDSLKKTLLVSNFSTPLMLN